MILMRPINEYKCECLAICVVRRMETYEIFEALLGVEAVARRIEASSHKATRAIKTVRLGPNEGGPLQNYCYRGPLAWLFFRDAIWWVWFL